MQNLFFLSHKSNNISTPSSFPSLLFHVFPLNSSLLYTYLHTNNFKLNFVFLYTSPQPVPTAAFLKLTFKRASPFNTFQYCVSITLPFIRSFFSVTMYHHYDFLSIFTWFVYSIFVVFLRYSFEGNGYSLSFRIKFNNWIFCTINTHLCLSCSLFFPFGLHSKLENPNFATETPLTRTNTRLLQHCRQMGTVNDN